MRKMNQLPLEMKWFMAILFVLLCGLAICEMIWPQSIGPITADDPWNAFGW